MRVLLLGYVDNNLGDDLIIKSLVDYFPNIDFYIYNVDKLFAKTFIKEKNLFFYESKIKKNEIPNFDFCIKLGGSMFIVNTFFNYIQRFFEIRFAKRLKKNKVSSAVIGSNYGPIKNNFGKFLIKKELAYKEVVTVRDSDSFRILKKFDLKHTKIGIFDDLVYNLSFEKKIKTENVIGISIYNGSKIEDKVTYYENMAYICNNLLEKKDCKIRLFAFDCEGENDLTSCFHVKERIIDKNKVEIVPYLGDYSSFLKIFSECNSIIAMRFHSLILSDMFRIPFLPISYSNKTENFLIDHNYDAAIVSLNDIESIDCCNYIIESIITNQNLYNNFNLQTNADGHVKMLTKLFDERNKDGKKIK